MSAASEKARVGTAFSTGSQHSQPWPVGGVVALIFAAVMAATAISGFCPLYLLLGRLSKRRKLA